MKIFPGPLHPWEFIMKTFARMALFAFFAALATPSFAEQPPEEMLKAVVKLSATVPETARTARILGTHREGNGVIIDEEGLVLTTGYLIIEAEKVEVTTLDGTTVPARFVAYDEIRGFGLARTHAPLKVAPLPLGTSSDIKPGDPVLVATFGGAEQVLGARVISRSEYAGYWEYLLEEAIYTTPAHPHFGGAGLIDRNGRLVAIGSLFTLLTVPDIGAVGCNVSIPIDPLKPILKDLLSTGRSPEAPRPWLGVNAEESHGRIFATRVTPGGPADEAGIKPNDIILKVKGQEVNDLADFYRHVWKLGVAGVEVPLTLLQGTEIRDVSVKSASRAGYYRMPGK